MKTSNCSKKRYITLIKYSEEHGEYELKEYLIIYINSAQSRSVLVHKSCHRDFTRIYSSVEHENAPSAKKLRSGLLPFNWKKECVLCGSKANFDTRHLQGQKYTRLLHSLLKIDSLNVAKDEVTHGDWKFKSAFMDVLI